jgi:hypothetical protein
MMLAPRWGNAAARWAIARRPARTRLTALAFDASPARHRLRSHPLGGHPNERFGVLVRTGIGKHLDVDLILTQIKLFEREAQRLLNRVGLNLDTRHPV